jgi:hypothetical protein
LAVLTDEFVRSSPAVAAPVDSVADLSGLHAAADAARFLRALSPDDLALLRDAGPARGVLDAAAEASARPAEPLGGHAPGTLSAGACPHATAPRAGPGWSGNDADDAWPTRASAGAPSSDHLGYWPQ